VHYEEVVHHEVVVDHEVGHHEVVDHEGEGHRVVSRRHLSSTLHLQSHLQQHEVCEVHRLVFQHLVGDVLLSPLTAGPHHEAMEVSDRDL
jgi:hypothetical protein